MLSRRTAPVLAQVIAELGARRWDVLSLAGSDEERQDDSGAGALAPARGPMSLRAIVYHRAAHEALLAELPATPTAMARWLDAHGGLGRYCAERFRGTSFTTCPEIVVEWSRVSAAPFEPLLAMS